MEARVLVTGPDHLVGDEADVRHRVVGVHRVGHDLLAPVLEPDVVPDPTVVAVGVVDVADVLLFPDAVGDAHDVVDDVAVVRLEAAHRLGLDVLRVLVQEPVGSAPAIGLERDPEVSGHVLVAQRIEPEMGPASVRGGGRVFGRDAGGRGRGWAAVRHGHGRSPLPADTGRRFFRVRVRSASDPAGASRVETSGRRVSGGGFALPLADEAEEHRPDQENHDDGQIPRRELPVRRPVIATRDGPMIAANLPIMLKNPKNSPLWAAGTKRA